MGSCLRDERREGVGAAWRCERMGRGQSPSLWLRDRNAGTVTSGMGTWWRREWLVGELTDPDAARAERTRKRLLYFVAHRDKIR